MGYTIATKFVDCIADGIRHHRIGYELIQHSTVWMAILCIILVLRTIAIPLVLGGIVLQPLFQAPE
jgi:hypothetical protein